jgi:hypothetical protein
MKPGEARVESLQVAPSLLRMGFVLRMRSASLPPCGPRIVRSYRGLPT